MILKLNSFELKYIQLYFIENVGTKVCVRSELVKTSPEIPSHYAILDDISAYHTVSYRSDLQLIHQFCLRQRSFNCISSVTISALFRNKCVTKALNSPLLAAVHFRKSLVSQRCQNPSCYRSTSRRSVQEQKFLSGSARTVRKKCLGLGPSGG